MTPSQQSNGVLVIEGETALHRGKISTPNWKRLSREGHKEGLAGSAVCMKAPRAAAPLEVVGDIVAAAILAAVERWHLARRNGRSNSRDLGASSAGPGGRIPAVRAARIAAGTASGCTARAAVHPQVVGAVRSAGLSPLQRAKGWSVGMAEPIPILSS